MLTSARMLRRLRISTSTEVGRDLQTLKRYSIVAKTPSIIPSRQLNVALPLPIYTKLVSHLYSELEGRVPHGAFSRFMVDRLQVYFTEASLDLAPYVGSAPGTMQVTGTPEAIAALTKVLES